MLSPFVTLTFYDNDKRQITVGNKSNPPNNSAIIKSFQYGQSDGSGAEVEIYDEEGGDFKYFVDKIVKNPEEAKTEYKAVVQWGWISASCGNSKNSISSQRSRCHQFSILTVDINISGKGIIFRLELRDLMQPMFETRITKVYNLTLKEAIRSMFRDATPAITDVQFKRSETEDFRFNGDVETKSAKFETNGLTPLAAAREWVSRYRTDRDKGIIVFYDNLIDCATGQDSTPPKVVFLEDPLPKCFEDKDRNCQFANLGTYIVNGGKHSPVLSFDPKIKFNFSTAARAAVVVGSETSIAATGTGQPCPPGGGGSTEVGSGSSGMVQVTEDMNRLLGNKDAPRDALRSQAANERANKNYESVEAEMRIQGNPALDNIYDLITKTVSIIVINPFHLANGGNGIDWLIPAPCNDILSNKNWRVKGVSHEVREGTYTTTLKLFLVSPGSN